MGQLSVSLNCSGVKILGVTCRGHWPSSTCIKKTTFFWIRKLSNFPYTEINSVLVSVVGGGVTEISFRNWSANVA